MMPLHLQRFCRVFAPPLRYCHIRCRHRREDRRLHCLPPPPTLTSPPPPPPPPILLLSFHPNHSSRHLNHRSVSLKVGNYGCIRSYLSIRRLFQCQIPSRTLPFASRLQRR